MKSALDPTVKAIHSEKMRSWLLLEDAVLFSQASITVDREDLEELAVEYVTKNAYFKAARSSSVPSSGWPSEFAPCHSLRPWTENP